MRKLNHRPSAVRAARESKQLTRTALAARVGCSLSLISEIESGTRNATDVRLKQIGKALGIPWRSLLAGSDARRTAAETGHGEVPAVRDPQRPNRADEVPEPGVQGAAAGEP